jgi:membrane carboxypeptidase/penicillin-binding protein PbpC
LQGKPEEEFLRPEGLTQAKVCTYSGLLPTPLCDKTHVEWFIDGTQPTQTDNIYQQVFIDSATGQLADDSTPASNRQPQIVLDLPAPLQRWAHSQGLQLLSDFAAQPSEAGSANLTLTSPQPGAAYRLSDQTTSSAQQIPVEALAGMGVTHVTIWVDGQQLAAFDAAPYLLWWPLAEGTHEFQARGIQANGQVVTSENVQITVTK